MPAFRYEAADAVGNTKKGVVNADSARAARADLRSQGLVPLSVDAIASQVDESGKIRKRALKITVFYLISFLIANYFMAYLISMDEVMRYYGLSQFMHD